ncbi:MAG: glycerol-3-phosphate dehydrogenase/oxidase, partial [Calditrichaeota bacterium]|nr:glycerol-3-phosphate dehydrogenase/oxidase [Calditrichota bacterium]
TKHYRLLDHARLGGPEGLLTVIGVKYTTARDVAEKTVNLAAKKLGKAKEGSRSRATPLVGGDIPRFASFVEDVLAQAPAGLSPALLRHLALNYGTEYARLLAYGQENAALLSPLPGSQVLAAEMVHAAREEMACTLSDAVLRRTELGSAEYPGDEAVEHCARLMAKELAWPARRLKSEVEDLRRAYPMLHTVA